MAFSYAPPQADNQYAPRAEQDSIWGWIVAFLIITIGAWALFASTDQIQKAPENGFPNKHMTPSVEPIPPMSPNLLPNTSLNDPAGVNAPAVTRGENGNGIGGGAPSTGGTINGGGSGIGLGPNAKPSAGPGVKNTTSPNSGQATPHANSNSQAKPINGTGSAHAGADTAGGNTPASAAASATPGP